MKPLHLAHAAILEELCQRGQEVLIGVGSAQRYDLRNPFTYEETEAMIHALLASRFHNYRVLPVPDLGHGPRWRQMLRGLMGELDMFVSANSYVRQLMETVYPLVHPLEFVPPQRHLPVAGEHVRRAMARGEPWQHLVPSVVAEFLERRCLPERFRRQFGLATLAQEFAPARRSQEEEHVLLG